jgi:hypothetical protein
VPKVCGQPPAVDQGDVDRRNVQHRHRRGEIDIFCGNAVRRVNIEPVLQRFKSLRVEVLARKQKADRNKDEGSEAHHSHGPVRQWSKPTFAAKLTNDAGLRGREIRRTR